MDKRIRGWVPVLLAAKRMQDRTFLTKKASKRGQVIIEWVLLNSNTLGILPL